ncbi:MAG: altronate dehydratase family protein [Synergistaceae bacterium]|nr:altronate dehydratase family protein [Synergistaceae bacterium]
MKFPEFIRLNDLDNVIVLPFGGSSGEGNGVFMLNGDIPPGHKAASRDIAEGEHVIKHGHPIGAATRDIARGDWVHRHNLAARTGTGASAPRLPKWEGAKSSMPGLMGGSFMGYRRMAERPGVRNDLWVIPTSGAVNGELRSILGNYGKPYWISSVKLLEHPLGGSDPREDTGTVAAILAGLAENPNAAGVLLVGLGCENISLSEIHSRVIGKDLNVMKLTLQDAPDCAGSVCRMLDELAAAAPRVREKFPVSQLCVGVKCGGGVGYAWLTANPLIGRFSDYLVEHGGAVVTTDASEMGRALDAVLPRMANKRAYDDFEVLYRWFHDRSAARDRPEGKISPQPDGTPGITTPEEKSLGALEKIGGKSLVTNVLRYGEGAYPAHGAQIAFAPGDDAISCTSMAGSGCQIILFATGGGTPFGSVVPTVKISAVTELKERHPGWIDFDAGVLLRGESLDEAAERLREHILSVACGERTAHEKKGFGEISIFRG